MQARRLKNAARLALLGVATILAACARYSLTEKIEIQCSDEEMVFIPSGWFTMGEDDGRLSNQPQHPVYLDAYCIHRVEVTRQAFIEFLSETGYQASGWSLPMSQTDPELPASGVIWKDAQAYCQWAGLRLPTEAEWEKAARGADGRRYPWGKDWDIHKANTAESGSAGPAPVGSFPLGASPYGILDMCGNVAEWVSDCFDPAYYSVSPDHDPTGPVLVSDHGLRGGSFASASDQSTTFFRDSSHSAQPNPRVGFRCATTAKSKGTAVWVR
jgi:formylglycine-generating enzyme required for sulfatase activity